MWLARSPNEDTWVGEVSALWLLRKTANEGRFTVMNTIKDHLYEDTPLGKGVSLIIH